ncbi:hypothetical protein, partial [Salmonella enterica]|uniref:hypothetical protein n=1 Tax=Salmonella enterica TaxID=28901 RepID=UPI003D2DB116
FDLPFDLGAADTKYWVVLTTSLISGAISVQEFNIATGEYTFTSNTASWTAPFPGKQVYYKLIAATGSGVPISSYDETQNAIG